MDGRLEISTGRPLTYLRRRRVASTQDRRRNRGCELLRHRIETLNRTVVRTVNAIRRTVEVPGDRHQVHRARRVVESRYLCRQHERRVRNIRLLRGCRGERRLPLRNDAPTERSNESARQRRQTLNRRRSELLESGVNDLQERPLLTSTFRVGTDPLRVAVARDDGAGTRGSHKRPAAPRTTVLRGLKNEAAVVAMGELPVDAYRTQLISEHSPNDGDHAP